jgi:tripartite-type tricarboxylate transporter receptor subunit TctC
VYRLLIAIICAAAASAPLHDASAQTYPAKPVRVIVSLAPAGGMDVTSRIFAQKLGEHLNQQVVVENRPGAGGAVGGDLVAKAPCGWLHPAHLEHRLCGNCELAQESALTTRSAISRRSR